MLLTGSEDCTLKLWNLQRARQKSRDSSRRYIVALALALSLSPRPRPRPSFGRELDRRAGTAAEGV